MNDGLALSEPPSHWIHEDMVGGALRLTSKPPDHETDASTAGTATGHSRYFTFPTAGNRSTRCGDTRTHEKSASGTEGTDGLDPSKRTKAIRTRVAPGGNVEQQIRSSWRATDDGFKSARGTGPARRCSPPGRFHGSGVVAAQPACVHGPAAHLPGGRPGVLHDRADRVNIHVLRVGFAAG